MQTDADWLAGLRVGDEVAVVARKGDRRTCRISRVTPALIVIGRSRFRRADGRIHGGKTWRNVASLQPVTREPLFSVGTWDADRSAYTPQRGLSVPSFNIPMRQLIVAVRELRGMGYSTHRRRDAGGSYEDNDPMVLIGRTDGRNWKDIRRSWNRARSCRPPASKRPSPS